MWHLRTLGGLSLTDDGNPSVSTARRRLAVLSVLAIAGQHGLSRDKLQTMLWPESGAASARHALDQLMYGLRRQLGEDALRGTNPIALVPERIDSDVQHFQEAVERGDVESAASCYGGAFIDGFYLADAPEFERWAEGERQRLSALYLGALQQLATSATVRGDISAAAEYWRRYATADPLSSRGAVSLMRALAASGDIAGALRHARAFDALIAQELDVGSDAAVRALVRELKASAPARVVSDGDTVSAVAPPSHVADAASAAPGAPHAVASLANETPDSRPAVGPARRRRRRDVFIGLTLSLAVAIVGLWWRTTARAADPTLDASRIAILPFRVVSRDSSLLYLQDGIVDLLALGLRDDGRSAIDPRTSIAAWRRIEGDSSRGRPAADDRDVARALRSGFFVRGAVVETPGSGLTLHAALVSTGDGRQRAEATVTGPPDELTALVGRLAGELLARDAGEYEERLHRATTQSLPALRAYLSGRAAQRQGRTRVAVAYFANAITLDSTFAVASLELVSTIGGPFWWTTTDTPNGAGVQLGSSSVQPTSDFLLKWRALQIASALRDRLSPADAAVLDAWRGPHFPQASFASEILEAWDRATRIGPDRAESWYWLGDVLLQQGMAQGLTDAPARAKAVFQLALEIDSTYLAPVMGLIEVAARTRDTAELRRVALRYLRHDSTSAGADYVRWRVAAALRDTLSLAAIRKHLSRFDDSSLGRILWAAQMDGVTMDIADSAAKLLVARAGDRTAWRLAWFSQGMLLLNRGRLIDSAPPPALASITASTDSYWSEVVDALFWEGDSSEAMPGVRAWSHRPAARQPAGIALWRAWHGDTAGVRATAARLMAKPEALSRDTTLGVVLIALASSLEQASDAALWRQRLDSLALRGCCDQPHWINLVAARLYERAGDLPAALVAARRCAWVYPPQYLSGCLFEEARLADLAGDRAGARRAVEHLLALRTPAARQRLAQVDSLRVVLHRLASDNAVGSPNLR